MVKSKDLQTVLNEIFRNQREENQNTHWLQVAYKLIQDTCCSKLKSSNLISK